MRTSKKLLSFFLAVVMVVTTCSVGFTAFAADSNKSLWTTNCEADDAFATLDGLADLLPSLLIGIPALGDPIYEKYAKDYGKDASELTDEEKQEIAGKATLQDVLGVLQPTLIGLLANVSQEAFVADILNDSSDPSNYDYLNREGSISYYTLYSICKTYKDDSSISRDTRATLTEWYDKLSPLAGLYQELANQQAQAEAKVGEIAERINSADVTFDSAFLQQLKDFDAAGGFAVTDEEQLLVDSFIQSANNSLRALGTSIVITDLPELIYYIFGAGSICINADYYCNLINLGGGTINFKQTADLLGIGVDVDYDLEGLTAENYADKLIDATFPACGMTLEELASNMGFSAELTRSMCENAFATTLVDVIIKDGAKTIEQSKYYTYMLKGLAVEYSDDITDPSQVDEAVISMMPAGWKTSECVLTDAEIADMASVFNSLRNSKNKAAISEYFLNGSANIYQASDAYNTVNATLPSVLKDTVPAEYFNMVMLETASEVTDHRLGLSKSFTGEAAFNSPTYEKDADNNFILNDQGHVILKGRDSQIGNPNGRDDDGVVQPMTINGYIAEAEVYAYSKYVANLFGITDFEADAYKLKTILNIDNAVGIQAERIIAEGGGTSGVVLTDEQKAILNADYDLTGSVGTEILNVILNGTVVNLVQMELLGTTVNGLVNNLLITPVDLTAALEDIWSRLYNNPVATIFELLPLLVVLIDELAEPVLLNNCKDEAWSNIIYNALEGGKIANYYLENGSHIGISQIGWDLNELLPDLMGWLLEGSDATGIDYYEGETVQLKEFVDHGDSTSFEIKHFGPTDIDTADVKRYTITDADGNQLTRVDNGDSATFYYKGESNTELQALLAPYPDADFTYTYTYQGNVPKLTGIYLVDLALRDAQISDLSTMLSASLGDTAGPAVAEVITELATLFRASVNKYVETYGDEKKYDNSGQILNSGLNNIFVALPQLFDIMEDLGAEKYGIDKDAWTYCFDGKIQSVQFKSYKDNFKDKNDGNKDRTDTYFCKTYDDGTEVWSSVVKGKTASIDRNDVPSYVLSGPGTVYDSGVAHGITVKDFTMKENSSLETFKAFAMSSDPNRSVDILDSFAGVFVEEWLNSIVSLVNNLVTTDNEFSTNLPIIFGLLKSLDGFGEKSVFTDIFNSVFQLKRGDKYSFDFEGDNRTGFTGLNRDNAYFLITNIETLVKVIKAMASSGNTEADAAGSDISTASLLASLASNDVVTEKFGASIDNYTDEEISQVNDVISELDTMLSSLLADSSINGYALNTTGNIASGLVSYLSRFITPDTSNALLTLIDTYLYYLSGKDRAADENGNMKPEEVYTNENLTSLVVRTFALIETVCGDLLSKFDYQYGTAEEPYTYNLISEAIGGVISPDAIGIRLDDADYADAQTEILKLDSWNDAIGTDGEISIRIDWNIQDGDNEAFFGGLATSLRLVTSILGVLLVDTGWYATVVAPVLGALCNNVGVKVDTFEEYADAGNAYRDEVLLGLLRPIAGWLDKLLAAPATTLIKTLQGVGAILDDSNTSAGTLASIVSGAVTPIQNELLGLKKVLECTTDSLGPVSPTLAAAIGKIANDTLGKLTVVENETLVNLLIKDIPLSGNNLIPIVNALLSGIGIKLDQIDWKAFSEASTPAEAILYLVDYIVSVVANNDNLDVIASLIDSEGTNSTVQTIIKAIKAGKLEGKDLIALVGKVLKVTKNPTIFAWSFEKYLQEAIEGFSYPLGLSKTQADTAVQDIDAVINNIFPLLKSLGVDLGGSNLNEILNAKLFTNELLSTIAIAMYNALDSNATIKQVLGIVGVKTSPADFAAILTDTTYGATFSAAAQTIGSAAAWSDFIKVTKNDKGEVTKTEYTTLNWGFTNGAANAQQGFVNALVAILRPLNDVLAVFLNSGKLDVPVYDLIIELLNGLAIEPLYLNISGTSYARIEVAVQDTVFTGTITPVILNEETGEYTDNPDGAPSVVKIDSKALLNKLKGLAIYGTNAYNSAVIPLLEAFQCTGIVSEAQYKADIAVAKDNLLLDVLNPILGGANTSLLNQIAAKPIETIATLLPNVAVYLDAHGLSQAVANLIAPITEIIYAVNDVIDLNTLIAGLLGAPEGTSLSDYVASLLGMKAGTLNIDLGDIASINLEDMIIPIVNTVLKGLKPNLDGKTAEQQAALQAQYALINKISIPDINWNALISLGERTTYTSLATDAQGNALTGKALKNVDYGKVLITVLRYVLNAVKTNLDSIKALVLGIESLAKNATLVSILNNVFTQINAHSADQIIVAIYYFFVGDNTADYWDYSSYKTKEYKFSYPQGVTEKDVEKLIAFIDGIIGEVDLNAILTQYVYTDNIINTLAKLIYTNIEKVKLSDTLTLAQLLSALGISLDTKGVASLLADKSYGETKQFEAAATAIGAAANWAAVDFNSLKWGVKDQSTFLHALVAILRPLYGVLDAIVADGKLNLLEGVNIPGSNGYVNSIVPLLEAFRCKNIKSYDKYLAEKNKEKDALLLNVLEPLFGFVNDVIASPIDTIASVLPNVALFIANDGLIQLVCNLITPITAIVKDVNPIIDVDKLLQELTKMPELSINNLGTFLDKYIGQKNIVPLINSLLSKTGIKLNDIDWFKLASLGTVKNEDSVVTCIGKRIVVDGDSDKVLITLLRYVLNTVLDNADAIKKLIGDSYKGALKEILDMIFKLDADKLLSVVFSLVNITQSPAEVYWCYKEYKSTLIKFAYPNGITAEDADRAVGQLDDAVSGVFALLGGLGVVNSSDLSGLVNDLLFKNEMVTKLAVALYGALDTEKLGPYLKMAGIPVSTKEVAKLLTDKSYGATYSSAAKKISSVSSWKKVSDVNWGFTDGAANAQQGFVNALVAVLRPVLDILGPFLNGTDLALGEILYNVVVGLDISTGNKDKGETLVTLKKGLLTIQTQSNGVYTTALELNLANLKTLKTLSLYGSNAYESAIIPLLDVLQVENSQIKSFDEYVKDCKKAKDNILLDVLNPLMSFINRVLEAPFDTITSVLPNLAYFIDNNGVGQLLNNVLAPVTEFLKEAKKQGVDIDKIIKLIIGKDLGKFIADALGVKSKINLKLTDLASCNIQEAVLPLINSLLKKNKIGIKLPNFEWSTIAAHGDVVTSKSAAENSEGKFTNKEVIANKGETLIAVLRYLADTIIRNSGSLKSLLCSIDAIKKNDTISSIIKSVFNTISTASSDQIVLAIFYFLQGEPTNAFWDYTAYQTGEYDFSYPEGMDVEFLKNLPPMLDGLIGGLADLNGLIGENLFKDELVSKLAVGLYGAIEGVKINDGTNLAQLLALTKIDFTTGNVSRLLVDERYGQTFASAAAVIKSAGSWSNVNVNSLKWGVKDRDSFFHALVAVLRPIYGVLDVLLNDASLGIFDIVRIPGSNGYTSSIVPLMEAFSMYNIKTQYQYREDIVEEYDNLLLDIINPLWDKIEDLLNAPLQTLAAMVPNLALFIGNDGLCQIIDNLLTPVSALIDAIKPVVNLNDLLTALLGALNVDLGSLLGKIGITNFKLDLYDLNATLKQVLGGDAIIPLINNLLGLIKIKGQPLGIKLNPVDWLQLASHGETIVSASQAATYGSRIFVEGDSSETLIAVLRYLINTVNTGDNYKTISNLIAGLLGDNVSDSISGVIDKVLGMLQGDTDEVIASLVDLLQMLA